MMRANASHPSTFLKNLAFLLAFWFAIIHPQNKKRAVRVRTVPAGGKHRIPSARLSVDLKVCFGSHFLSFSGLYHTGKILSSLFFPVGDFLSTIRVYPQKKAMSRDN